MTNEEKILVELAQLKAGLGLVIKATAPAQWDNFLVATGQSATLAPTAAQVAQNPGLYYGTRYDSLAGSVTQPVVEIFLPPTEDAEGNKTYKFTGGTLYDWAKADLESFLVYYATRYRVSLNMLALSPEQRAKMGLNG